jgi:hypothetical protein
MTLSLRNYRRTRPRPMPALSGSNHLILCLLSCRFRICSADGDLSNRVFAKFRSKWRAPFPTFVADPRTVRSPESHLDVVARRVTVSPGRSGRHCCSTRSATRRLCGPSARMLESRRNNDTGSPGSQSRLEICRGRDIYQPYQECNSAIHHMALWPVRERTRRYRCRPANSSASRAALVAKIVAHERNQHPQFLVRTVNIHISMSAMTAHSDTEPETRSSHMQAVFISYWRALTLRVRLGSCLPTQPLSMMNSMAFGSW